VIDCSVIVVCIHQIFTIFSFRGEELPDILTMPGLPWTSQGYSLRSDP